MTVTRDPDCPEHIAAPFQAFSRCSEGYDAQVVLEASANMVVAAIGLISRNGGTLESANELTDQVADGIRAGVALNWQRRQQPTDIVVPNGQ